MSNNKKNGSTEGVGFLGLLALIFITLKLTSVIDWSWWWVLSPLWIPTSITLLIFVILLVGVVGVAIGKASRIPVAKGENLDRIAKLHGLQRGYMESDERLRKRIIETMKTTNRRSRS
ncbi:MAG TPA: hypothetical protein PLY59_07545 [Clostridiales bacterium]|nr:hypothetical protein [Clostridiales bacterium]